MVDALFKGELGDSLNGLGITGPLDILEGQREGLPADTIEGGSDGVRSVVYGKKGFSTELPVSFRWFGHRVVVWWKKVVMSTIFPVLT